MRQGLGVGVHVNVCVEGVEATYFHARHSPIKQLKILPHPNLLQCLQ